MQPRYDPPPVPRDPRLAPFGFVSFFFGIFGGCLLLTGGALLVLFLALPATRGSPLLAVPSGLLAVAAMMLAIAFRQRAAERRLISTGQAVVARVVRVTRGTGRGAARGYVVEYRIEGDGALANESDRVWRPPLPGELVWVAFAQGSSPRALLLPGWPEAQDPRAALGEWRG